MNRVRNPHPCLVCGLAALGGELAAVLQVELGVLAGDRVDLGAGVAVRLLKQSTADNLEGLLRGRRSPLVSYAAHNVLKSLERLSPVRATDLEVRPAGRLTVATGV